jgi:TonB family protein
MDPRNLSLSRAVSDGDIEAVRALLAEGVDANRTASGGQTPLILAIVFRNIHILRLLLEAGADPKVRDSLGLNAFDWAERKGFTEGVTLLAQSQSPIHDSRASTPHTEPTVPNRSESRNVKKDSPRAARQPKAKIIPQEASSAEAGADSERIPQLRSSTIDPWTKSFNRKRCPKCNAVYNGELVAYCAVDMTPLVDVNQPGNTSPPATATATPPLIWILVASTFIVVASTTYLITDRLTRVERVSTPKAEPPLQAADVKSELPVVGEELVGKALTLPRAEYPPTARSEGVGGRILVRVRVDQKGRVISARSFEGDWRLRAAAVKAATSATFSAERLNDREAEGTIVYTFKP